MKILLPVLFCLIVLPLYARIGETPEEIIARFGQPTTVDDENQFLNWNIDGLSYGVKFFAPDDYPNRHVSIFEMLKVLDGSDLSDAQVGKFLNANGSNWHVIEPDYSGGGDIIWQDYRLKPDVSIERLTNAEETILAAVNRTAGTVIIMNSSGASIMLKAFKADETAKAIDF